MTRIHTGRSQMRVAGIRTMGAPVELFDVPNRGSWPTMKC